VTIIEEEDGSVARLELAFQDPEVPGADIPENVCRVPLNFGSIKVITYYSDANIETLQSTVAIKEPYFKFNGDGTYVIRVDHPSDIAILRGDDPAVSMIMEVVAKAKEITPAAWKVAGDQAYLEKNYSSAIEW